LHVATSVVLLLLLLQLVVVLGVLGLLVNVMGVHHCHGGLLGMGRRDKGPSVMGSVAIVPLPPLFFF